MSTIEMTCCPACLHEIPLSQSHKLGGRYLCVEGQTAGGSHRFMLITLAGVMVAEADTIEDASAAADHLTSEQGRQIIMVERGAFEERRSIVRALKAKRDRMLDGLRVAQRAGMPRSPIADGSLDAVGEMIEELSIWTV